MDCIRRSVVGAAALCLLVAAGVFASSTYYVDPAHGSPRGNGTALRPWRTLEEVARGGRLRTGDTILLRSGHHGDVTLSGNNATTITIAAQPGHVPQLSRLVVRQGRRWRIKGLAISPSFGGEAYKGNIVTIAEGGPSAEIVFEDCFVFSASDSSAWTAKQWMSANSGIFSGRHGTGITLRNNYVLNTRFGMSLCSPDSLCEGNVVSRFSGDGIRVTRDGITVQYNVIRNIYVGDKDGDKNHDDGIQCFLFNKGTGTVRRVTIRGNIIADCDGEKRGLATHMQGIGFFDGPLVEFLVEKNVVMVAHWHGVSLYDAQGCRILDNTCYTRWPGKCKPWVMIGTKKKGGGPKGNTVNGNLAHSIRLRADPGVVAANNGTVTEAMAFARLGELAAFIDAKYGRFHPVAGCARLSDQKARDISVKSGEAARR